MPRIRTVKPEFFSHEELSALPAEVHLLAAALLCHADDEGYFKANPSLVKAACSPLREDSVSIHEQLTHLSSVGYIRLGTGSDGKRYGHIRKFLNHQRVNRPTPSNIKDMDIQWDGLTEGSLNTHGGLTEDSLGEGRKGRERKGKEQANGTNLPDWLPESTWHDWVRFRAEKKKPVTETVAKHCIKQLEKMRDQGQDPVAVIERSISNGWQGLFEIKDQEPRRPRLRSIREATE